jgi:hypothetical protein
MNQFFFLLSSVALLLISACGKEEYDLRKASEQYCRDNMVFSCEEDPDAEIYFRGKLNGEEFCISVPQNNYFAHSGVTITATTLIGEEYSASTPLTGSFYRMAIRPPIFDNLNGITRDFEPVFTLDSPTINDTVAYAPEYYLDEYFQEGELPIRKDGEASTEGFRFFITWSTVLRPGYEHYKRKDPAMIPVVGMGISPTFGPANHAKLELTEMEKRATPEGFRYYFTFKMDADLFYLCQYFAGDRFGTLADGEFRMIIDI